ncbi:MAG TPA: hypothetical protein VHW23_02780 [Kofleriaceae bacterium]|nr:hypothetical protein [Kofleriaceae bacterium]
MSSRVTGAGLALIAVALLVVSLLTPAVLPAQLSLFAGHPTVAQHTRTTQDIYVGLYSAQLCNSGGDGTCKSGDATGGFRAVGYAELGLTGLLAASAVALALLTLQRSERRKSAARAVWAVGGLAIVCAGAMVALGPFHGASAPVGVGMALQAAGILGAMIGGVLAIQPPAPIRLRVADRGAQPRALPTAQAFSRRAARDSRSGEHDPRPSAPDMSQLRPLYDANPAHGGTGGLRPAIASPSSGPMRIPPPSLAGIPSGPLGTDEPTAAAPPLADAPRPFADAARPPLPFADASRPMPPFADTSRPMPPLFTPDPPRQPSSRPSEERPGVPLPVNDLRPDLRPTVQHAAADEPRQTAPRFAVQEPRDESRPPAPPLAARVKPTTLPPPLPASVLAAKPRTQVSLVPPMPDNDLPVAPPTAQIATDGPNLAGSSGADPASFPAAFPRAETPLAPPPLPIAPPPPIRREPPPRTARDTQSPALRAAVPMPVRPGRSAPGPTRPPLPAPTRGAPPRPTIATTVPPIPTIPAIPATIPPIPPPRRADTDITDPDGVAAVSSEGDGATVSRVPIEVGDYVSQTNVSVDVPLPEDGDAGYVPDTSPSGEPVAASAAAIAARPTIQAAAQAPPRGVDQPTIIASPISPAAPPAAPPSAPAARDRPMPKLPISTAPDSLPPPKDSKPAIGPSPACPQCEAPMAWVEEHLRFYCKSCRMYF